MKIHRFIVAALATIAFLNAQPGFAQQNREGAGVRVTVGVVWNRVAWGRTSHSSGFGLTIGTQVWTRKLVFDAAFQPTRIRNPVLKEAVRPLILQLGHDFGGRTYVRPSAGLVVKFWSGADAPKQKV